MLILPSRTLAARRSIEVPRRPRFRARPSRLPGRRYFDRLRVPTRNMADGDEMEDASGNVILDASGNVLLDDGAGCSSCCVPACSGCASGSPPAKILASISGMSAGALACTCYHSSDTSGAGKSYKFTGDLNGATFCLSSVGACQWKYDGPCPITVTKYNGTACNIVNPLNPPLGTSTRIVITFDLFAATFVARMVDSDGWAMFSFFSSSLGTLFDCGISHTETNTRVGGSVFCDSGNPAICTDETCYTYGGTVTLTPASSC